MRAAGLGRVGDEGTNLGRLGLVNLLSLMAQYILNARHAIINTC
jgi:hypothetical protein